MVRYSVLNNDECAIDECALSTLQCSEQQHAVVQHSQTVPLVLHDKHGKLCDDQRCTDDLCSRQVIRVLPMSTSSPGKTADPCLRVHACSLPVTAPMLSHLNDIPCFPAQWLVRQLL